MIDKIHRIMISSFIFVREITAGNVLLLQARVDELLAHCRNS